MSDVAILDRAFGEVRLAVLGSDDRIRDFFYFHDEEPSRVGEVHLARVRRLAPALGGAFLELADGEALLKAAAKRIPPEGAPLAVRIRSEPGGAKLPVASLLDTADAAAFAGRCDAPALLFRDPAPWLSILRQRGAERVAKIVTDAPEIAAALKNLPPDASWLSNCLVFDRKPEPLMARMGLEGQIGELASSFVPLGQGAHLTIEETRALTAIDVDAGGAVEGRDERRAALAANMRAASEIARQLRLRRVGGLAVVDFLRLRVPRDREALLTAFDDALSHLTWPHERGRFSRFGLLDLNIARQGRSLATETASLAVAARSALRAAVASTRTHPGRLPVIVCAPSLATKIESIERGEEFWKTAGAPLVLERDSSLDPAGFRTYLKDRG